MHHLSERLTIGKIRASVTQKTNTINMTSAAYGMMKCNALNIRLVNAVFTSAPWSNNSHTDSNWPWRDAWWSRVRQSQFPLAFWMLSHHDLESGVCAPSTEALQLRISNLHASISPRCAHLVSSIRHSAYSRTIAGSRLATISLTFAASSRKMALSRLVLHPHSDVGRHFIIWCPCKPSCWEISRFLRRLPMT